MFLQGPSDISPGPGQYAPAAAPDGPAWSIAGRTQKPEAPESPGPTDYQQTCVCLFFVEECSKVRQHWSRSDLMSLLIANCLSR